MKVKKAFKRLKRAEALVASVLREYVEAHPRIRGLVNSAQASVRIAKEAIGHPASPVDKKRVLAKAEEGGKASRATRAQADRRRRVAKRRVLAKAAAKPKKRAVPKVAAVRKSGSKAAKVKRAVAHRRVLRQPATTPVVTSGAEPASARSGQTVTEAVGTL